MGDHGAIAGYDRIYRGRRHPQKDKLKELKLKSQQRFKELFVHTRKEVL